MVLGMESNTNNGATKMKTLTAIQSETLSNFTADHNATWESGRGVNLGWDQDSKVTKSTLDALVRKGFLTVCAGHTNAPHLFQWYKLA
jgi:hypothetical protein